MSRRGRSHGDSHHGGQARRATRLHFLPAAMALLAVCLLAAPAAANVLVLFTVDVESGYGGGVDRDIWGRLPGESEEHGIGRMMDIFDRHGTKATFFVNVYEAGRDQAEAMAEVCRTIHRRGHDLELHTHPQPMFGVLAMDRADAATQAKILERGRELIRQWTGAEVIAHRAGAYAANLDTVAACRQVGIPLDMSLNAAWPGCRLAGQVQTENAASVVDDVLCVPVTTYAQVRLGSWRSLRFLDIESSSPEEIRSVIAGLDAAGVKTAVIMMHSFSFTRGGRVNHRAEAALEGLLTSFDADERVSVVTARQVVDLWRQSPETVLGTDAEPTTGVWLMYRRAWQRLDEGWKNVAVAFSPLVPMAVVVGWLIVRRRRRRAVRV